MDCSTAKCYGSIYTSKVPKSTVTSTQVARSLKLPTEKSLNLKKRWQTSDMTYSKGKFVLFNNTSTLIFISSAIGRQAYGHCDRFLYRKPTVAT